MMDRPVMPSTTPLPPVTVTDALPETGPPYPCELAEIVVVPGPTAVTTPAELTVATPGMAELQVTWLVIFCLVGSFAFPKVPVAVNCNVGPPTTREAVSGVTAMESSPPEEVLQPAIGRARPISISAFK
jgi:hypothetical protein